MYGLDLFSGIGGLTKALEGYVTPVAYCENDRYAQAVLLSRMSSGDIPVAPIWNDVKTINKTHITPPEIIYGGFPCQDISVAGRGEGLGGERSGLFFEIARLVGEIRPRFVFLENVSAITVRGAERVVGELCRLGYDARWGILSAADVGANHRRERWWLLAHAIGDGRREDGPWQSAGSSKNASDADGEILRNESRRRSGKDGQDKAGARDDGAPGYVAHSQCSEWWPLTQEWNEPNRDDAGRKEAAGRSGKRSQDVADAQSIKCQRIGNPRYRRNRSSNGRNTLANAPGSRSQDRPEGRVRAENTKGSGGLVPEPERQSGAWWSIEPNVGRVAHGVPLRVDRLRGLGNAVVPAQAREAFERLMGFK